MPAKGKWREFVKARLYAQSLGLKNQKEWQAFVKTSDRPKDIPVNPNSVYNEWVSLADWLGLSVISPKNRQFLSYIEAKAVVIKFGIKSISEWKKFTKSGSLPINIPTNPNRTYKDSGWSTWGEWLGTGTIAPGLIEYLDFSLARIYAHSLNLKTFEEWATFCKSGVKPINIPSCPDKIYKNNGWVNFGDWLGTGNFSNREKRFIYRSYDEARLFVLNQNIRSIKEWRKFSASGERPVDIPGKPEKFFKNNGWVSWGEFLGTGNISNFDKMSLPFIQAREIVRSKKFTSLEEWREFNKSKQGIEGVPSYPCKVYRDCGWIDYKDWFGISKWAHQESAFLPYEEAQSIVISMNISSISKWKIFCNSGQRPDNIPNNPNIVYSDSGWENWGKWLGTGKVAPQFMKEQLYLSFQESRRFVQKLKLNSSKEWHQYCGSGKKPNYIPQSPNVVYKGLGWNGYGDWLGTGNIAPQNATYMDFYLAREKVRALGLKSKDEWARFCRSENKIEGIPYKAWQTYKNKGWVSTQDWLGYDENLHLSTGHQKVKAILEDNDFKFKEEYFLKIKGYSGRLYIDFAIKSRRIYIEWDGLQHFVSVPSWGGDEKFKEGLYRDRLKDQYCIDNNISLIRLSYSLEKDPELLRGGVIDTIQEIESQPPNERGKVWYIGEEYAQILNLDLKQVA